MICLEPNGRKQHWKTGLFAIGWTWWRRLNRSVDAAVGITMCFILNCFPNNQFIFLELKSWLFHIWDWKVMQERLFRNMNQLRMIWERIGKIPASSRGTETLVWKRFLYQVLVLVGTNASTSKKCKFYNSMVKAILRGGGDYDTKVVALCSHFVDMGAMVKT